MEYRDRTISQSVEPKAYAAPFVHEKVLSLLEKEPKGRVLDAPAGEGFASVRLDRLGFEVYALDIEEKQFKPKNIKFEKADLNDTLPYSDSFFDYVVCIEGIEHIENPNHLIREFKRILKKGGKLIITTPNVLSVYGRLRYLLSGYSDWFHSRINLYEGDVDFVSGHINMVGFPELYFILNKNEFEIEVVLSNRSVLIYPWGKFFLKPFVALVFLLVAGIIKLFYKVRKDAITLSEYLLKKDLLWGEILILKAKKR